MGNLSVSAPRTADSGGHKASAVDLPTAPGSTSGMAMSGDLARLSWRADPEAVRRRIAARTPLILTDLAADWPALARWTPEFLAERYGDRAVRVYDASFGEPGANYMGSVDRLSFAEFLREVLGQGRDLRMFLYNLSHHIPELLDDVRFPDLGLSFSRRFVFTFFGCQGAVTPLHFDIDLSQVVYTAIHGRRRIRLFAPEQRTALYQHPFTVRSYVDLDQPDYAAHPKLATAQGYELTLAPGESLYMPPGYWHEFNYLDAGFGISLRAAPPDLSHRLEGALNLLLRSPVDRIGNRLAGRRWFDWKTRQAARRANA